jgi:hypothetical protein
MLSRSRSQSAPRPQDEPVGGTHGVSIRNNDTNPSHRRRAIAHCLKLLARIDREARELKALIAEAAGRWQ